MQYLILILPASISFHQNDAMTSILIFFSSYSKWSNSPKKTKTEKTAMTMFNYTGILLFPVTDGLLIICPFYCILRPEGLLIKQFYLICECFRMSSFPENLVHIEEVEEETSARSRRSSSESSKRSVTPTPSNSEDEFVKDVESEEGQRRGETSDGEHDEQDQDRKEEEEEELPFDYLNRISGEGGKPKDGSWIQKFINLVSEEVYFGRSQLPNCASETELGELIL